MVGTLQPLDMTFAIVDDQGRPTIYFTRWAQARQDDIQNSGVWGKIEGTLADQEDLKTALDGKLSVTPEDAFYGPNSFAIIPDPNGFSALSAGDIGSVSAATINSGVASDPNAAGFSYDLSGFVGGAWFGTKTVNSRVALHSYGTITGFEFNQMPYVGLDRMIAMTGNTLVNALNDAAAAAAGIPVGGLYRNGSVVMIRVV
jgi:hypothetical protein